MDLAEQAPSVVISCRTAIKARNGVEYVQCFGPACKAGFKCPESPAEGYKDDEGTEASLL